MRDRIHEFMTAQPMRLEQLEPELESLKGATPILTLHLHCYHTNVHSNDSTEKITTLRASQSLPVLSSSDVSVAPAQYADMVKESLERVVAIQLQKEYRFNPEDAAWVERMQRLYVLDNEWRDRYTDIQLEYTFLEPHLEAKHILAIVKARPDEVQYIYIYVYIYY